MINYSIENLGDKGNVLKDERGGIMNDSPNYLEI
jgi:hypothetical protein